MSFRGFLAQQSVNWRSLRAPPGAWIMEEFLAQVGIDCAAQALPPEFVRLVPHACFDNTARLVRRMRCKLRYCEGYIGRDDLPIPIHHAWAIDADNRVIDPTLAEPEKYSFIGFPISLAERRRWISEHSQSVFDTGVGRNVKFMVQQHPPLLDLIDTRYHHLITGEKS